MVKADVVQNAPVIATSRRSKPVIIFAVIGALGWAMQTYVFARWLASGPTRTLPGPDPIPSSMQVTLIIAQIVLPITGLVCLYFFVIKPLWRTRLLPLTGMLCLAHMGSLWLDISSNYFNHTYTYNAGLINFGSWYSFIPGWSSPRANYLAEPLLWVVPGTLMSVVLPAVLLAYLMRRAKRRWPRMGVLGILGIGFVLAVVADLAIEGPLVRTGAYAFTGTIPSWTLFSGHYYQFPIYQAIILGGLWFLPFAALLYFTDDKGQSFAERGLDQVTASPKQKGVLRFLSISGFTTVAYLAYSIAMALVTMLPGFQWNEDVVQNRSYLRDELCGAGTTYACPASDIPVPKDGTYHVSPSGELMPPSR